MKRIFFAFSLLTLLLSSCNLPGSQIPTSSINDVATRVALTLTPAAASQPSLAVTPSTAVPVTPSPVLTATPTVTLTASVSPTVTSTSLPSVVPTNTISPDDPKQSLGEPAWKDSLNNGKGFGIGSDGYDDGNTQITVSNGAMQISNSSTLGYRGWRLTSSAPKDYYLEGTFYSGRCGGSDAFGLVTRAKDYDSGFGYYFGIGCDGTYSLVKWDDGGTTSIISPTPAASILKGSGQINHIGIMLKGDSIKLYSQSKTFDRSQGFDLHG